MADEQRRHHAQQGVMNRLVETILVRDRLALPLRHDTLLAIGVGFIACGGGAPAQQAQETSARPRGRGCGAQQARELVVDHRGDARPCRGVLGFDGLDVGSDAALQQCRDDAAEIDAQILDAGAVGHRQIRRHPYQKLVQRESARTKGDQVGDLETGEVAPLLGVGHAGVDIFGAEYRRQVQEVARNLRAYAGVPGSVLDGLQCCGTIHWRD